MENMIPWESLNGRFPVQSSAIRKKILKEMGSEMYTTNVYVEYGS